MKSLKAFKTNQISVRSSKKKKTYFQSYWRLRVLLYIKMKSLDLTYWKRNQEKNEMSTVLLLCRVTSDATGMINSFFSVCSISCQQLLKMYGGVFWPGIPYQICRSMLCADIFERVFSNFYTHWFLSSPDPIILYGLDTYENYSHTRTLICQVESIKTKN